MDKIGQKSTFQEEQRRKEQEEAEAKAKKEAKKAAALAKKQAKQAKSADQSQLPKLVSSTYSDLKKRFQTSVKDDPSQATTTTTTSTVEKPRVRKLMDNPFEQKRTLEEDAAKKSAKGFSSGGGQGRISEMKKRYSQLFSSTTQIVAPTQVPAPVSASADAQDEKDHSDVMQVDASESSLKEPKEETCPTLLEPASSPATTVTSMSAVTSSVAEKTNLSLLRRSKDHIDKSCEKLLRRFSKERLNEPPLNSGKPTKDDMQCYLLSHVLYDGQKSVANAKKEPDWLDTLDEDIELEKGMLEDDYIKDMERYLALFDTDDKKSSKKKSKTKKKTKAKDEPAVKLVTVEVSDLKKRFEKARVAEPRFEPVPPKIDLIVDQQNVDKFKEMFETQNVTAVVTDADNDAKVNSGNLQPRRSGRLLNSDLLKKFDSPEMAEELKRQREKDREDRRLARLKKMEDDKRKAEEERKRIEEGDEQPLFLATFQVLRNRK